MAENITIDFSECLMSVAKVKWVIRNFPNLRLKNGQILQSSEFRLSDSSWKIEIYPKGDTVKSSKSISLFLRRVSGHEECYISFSLEIVSGALKKKLKGTGVFNETAPVWGWTSFIPISDVLKSLQSLDGEITIFLEVESIADGNSIVNGDLQSARQQTGAFVYFSKNFETLFLDDLHSDVKLRVREQEFNAHKLVLSCRSPVFSAMFQHEMVENKTGIVEINDINPEIFKDFLHFVYSAKLDCVKPENVMELYNAAEKYDLKDLKEVCVFKMGNSLSSETILDYHLFAEKYEESSLLMVTTNYISENAEVIWQTDKWKNFFLENPNIANKLMLKVLTNVKTRQK